MENHLRVPIRNLSTYFITQIYEINERVSITMEERWKDCAK